MSGARQRAGARDRILAAAVRRIASEGIDGVRIARIAMDAGVSTSLVHYHFDSREALLAEALDYSYTRAGDARISSGEPAAGASHAERLPSMIGQCLPTTESLREDWVLWVELWLRAVRHPELRPVAEELYARMHAWFADEIAAGVARRRVRALRPRRGRRPRRWPCSTASGSATLIGDARSRWSAPGGRSSRRWPATSASASDSWPGQSGTPGYETEPTPAPDPSSR